MLILVMFVLMSIAVIVLSYTQLIRINLKMIEAKKQTLRAYYAARAGIEDALYEIKQGRTWNKTNLKSEGGALDIQWLHNGTASDNVLYKSNDPVLPAEARISHFDYPVTFSVQVSFEGEPSQSTINILSTGQVVNASYSRQLLAKAARTLNDEVFVLEMKEL